MTTKEFWKKYMDLNPLDFFNISCNFFSKELPQEFIDEYDVGEVILETKGHQESAKNFDNVMRFTEILQTKQPELYKEYFQYFDDFLIDYYCFQQNGLKVKKSFTNFLNDPIHDYDKYLIAFKKLLFYQHPELLEQAITQNFKAVSESDNLIGYAEYDLAICKFYKSIQNIFNTHKQTFDKRRFTAELKEFNFDFEEKILSYYETGLLNPYLNADELKSLFLKNKEKSMFIIESYFLRDMHEKGFEFYLSGKIWEEMMKYWHENNKKNKTTDSNFKINEELFEKHLISFSGGMFIDNTSEMIAILWGSVYVYEFLAKIKVISEDAFNDFIEISRKIKGKIIGRFTADLWNSNFVHTWKKPECISEAEFLEEKKIFEKSLTFKYAEFDIIKDEISEELSNIGELSEYIVDEGRNAQMMGERSLINTLFDSGREETDRYYNTPQEPFIAEKKINRNEPCPCGSGKKYKKCCG